MKYISVYFCDCTKFLFLSIKCFILESSVAYCELVLLIARCNPTKHVLYIFDKSFVGIIKFINSNFFFLCCIFA